eukprot:COSAG05_NODE_4342_length_1558_cov_2.212474_1_plen_20_part_10
MQISYYYKYMDNVREYMYIT